MKKLVVHVPQSSIAIPDDVWSEFVVLKSSIEVRSSVFDMHSE